MMFRRRVDNEERKVGIIIYTSQKQSGVERWSVKTKFLKILQNSLENTCVRVSFLIKL